jgi:hypothetical protein
LLFLLAIIKMFGLDVIVAFLMGSLVTILVFIGIAIMYL